MTEKQWLAFSSFRDEFKSLCEKWNLLSEVLKPLQIEAYKKDTPEYPVELPIVYNKAYDEIRPDSDIRLVVIGDNPGKDEQREKNSRYLVGQSGKVAEGFFRRNPELGIDFRKNVIISNKTPVHTAKTLHLNYLKKNGGEEICTLISESQREMARLVAELHQKLVEGCDPNSFVPELWLVGNAELKPKKLFVEYRDTLKNCYQNKTSAWDKVFVYHHFSMNRFLVDLKAFREKNKSLCLKDALVELGHQHRDEIFSLC